MGAGGEGVVEGAGVDLNGCFFVIGCVGGGLSGVGGWLEVGGAGWRGLWLWRWCWFGWCGVWGLWIDDDGRRDRWGDDGFGGDGNGNGAARGFISSGVSALGGNFVGSRGELAGLWLNSPFVTVAVPFSAPSTWMLTSFTVE